MCFIATTPPEEASGEVGDMYRQLQGSLDYLPNYARVFCHRPGVMQAWSALQQAIRAPMDDRAFGLVTLASALACHSSYCALAHAKKLVSRYFSPAELAGIVRDPATSVLSEADKAMMALATKVATDASGVTREDIDRLRRLGWDDARVFDVVATAAARCFFARIPDALGARPDAALGRMDDDLRELLIVGRPIAASNNHGEFNAGFNAGGASYSCPEQIPVPRC